MVALSGEPVANQYSRVWGSSRIFEIGIRVRQRGQGWDYEGEVELEGVRGSMQRWTKVHSHLPRKGREAGNEKFWDKEREREIIFWVVKGVKGRRDEMRWERGNRERESEYNSESESRARVRSLPGNQGVRIPKGSLLLEKVISASHPKGSRIHNRTRFKFFSFLIQRLFFLYSILWLWGEARIIRNNKSRYYTKIDNWQHPGKWEKALRHDQLYPVSKHS